MFVALMFFVSLMFLFGYHCWLVAKNRSTLGEDLHIYCEAALSPPVKIFAGNSACAMAAGPFVKVDVED